MKTEITTLEQNKTWDLAALPPDKKAIGRQWIYNIKYRSNGEIKRFNMTIVVKEYS